MTTQKTLLRSSYLLPSADDSLIKDGAVVWEGETIVEVGKYVDVMEHHPDAIVNEYKDHIVFPGLVNAHDHGTGVSYPQMGTPDLPLELWLPLLVDASYADPYLAALYQGILLLLNGVTTTIHQHDPRDWRLLEEELLETARGYRDAGIRATVCLTLADQNQLAYIGDKEFIDSLPKNLATQIRESGMGVIPLETKDFLDIGARLKQEWAGDPWTCFSWGPFGPQWCSDDLLMAVHDVAGDAPIQLHLLETCYQRTYADHAYGRSTVAHLNNIGFLTPNVSCAHAIWLSEGEIEILASTNTAVVHCPSSNLRIRSGIAPVLDFIDAGVAVGIGLDGVSLNDHQDMLLEMKLARGLAFEPGLEGRFLTTRQVLKMATEVGARIVGQTQGGRLVPGADADLMTLRLNNISQPFLDERIDLLEAVILRAQGRDVDTVVVAGEVLIQNGMHVKQDNQAVAALIHEWYSTQSYSNRREHENLVDQLIPYIKEVYKDW